MEKSPAPRIFSNFEDIILVSVKMNKCAETFIVSLDKSDFFIVDNQKHVKFVGQLFSKLVNLRNNSLC